MKVAALCLLFVSLILADDVLVLDNTNFDQTLAENPVILVEFYAPWCGHCKNLEPEYASAATALKGVMPLAKVDADAESNRPFAAKYEIQGFPTIKLFRNGVPTDYNGGRTAADIISYCTKQARSAITDFTTLADLQAFVGSDELVAVGFFDAGSAELGVFTAQAELGREQYGFASVVGKPEINKEYGVDKTPAVLYFRKFAKEPLRFEGKFEEIQSFLSKNSLPIISEIGPGNFRKFAEAGRPLTYVFVDLTVNGQLDDVLAKVTPVAASSQDKLVWCYIDWSKYAKHSERLGLTGAVVPAIAIDNMQDGFHYAFDEAETITQESVQAWVEKFKSGDLKPTLKSEAVPADNNGPVKVVVGLNYDEIVLDSTKDVLVEFYAPWCGHCKQLAPIYEQVGEHFQGNANVIVAKIDATANDVNPKLGIRGFPTLKLFKANDKANPIDYNGDRTKESLIQFIEQNASTGAAAADAKKDEL